MGGGITLYRAGEMGADGRDGWGRMGLDKAERAGTGAIKLSLWRGEIRIAAGSFIPSL